MVFVSAGHNTGGLKKDPGAVANGFKEADLTAEFRNLVVAECNKIGLKTITDKDDESLSQYLNRIKTGNGSVVIEFHFDAAAAASATGITALIGVDADKNDKDFAADLSHLSSCVLGIRNRGVKSEAESNRGRLGLMRKEGIVCLLELGFITNLSDLNAYQKNKKTLAKDMALILQKYENIL